MEPISAPSGAHVIDLGHGAEAAATARNLVTGSSGLPRGLESGLLSYGSVQAFRAATPLPKNTQEVIDSAVNRIGRQRLTIVSDLIDAGLAVSLPNWLAIPFLTSHKVGEAGFAQRSMLPKSRGERQILPRTPFTIPIYCTWDDFSFGIRELLASERVGEPLDVSHVEQATRNVNEAIEDAGINGAITADGNSTPGLLSSTNTWSYVGNEAWDNSGHTGEEIFTDVQAGIDVLIADRFYGPYNVYVPTTYWSKLNADYKSATSGTTLERLQSISYGGRPINIKVADFLPANRVLIIQMTSDVVDVIVGQQPTVVTWTDGPGWERYFVVLACVVTRVKSNYNSNFGIALGNTT